MKVKELLNNQCALSQFDKLRNAYEAAKDLKRLVNREIPHGMSVNAQALRMRRIFEAIGVEPIISAIEKEIENFENKENI